MHKERVRSVDQLVEEWKGTGPGQPQNMGKDWGQLARGPSKGGKPYQFKQEEERWQRSQSPDRFEDDYGELDSAFMERQTPGGEDKGYFEGPREIKVDQLQDNRSRHQGGERVVMISSWREGTGHICTTPIIGTRVWVLGTHPPGDKAISIVGSHPARGGRWCMIMVAT